MKTICVYVHAQCESERCDAVRALQARCKAGQVVISMNAPFKADHHFYIDYDGKTRRLKRAFNVAALRV